MMQTSSRVDSLRFFLGALHLPRFSVPFAASFTILSTVPFKGATVTLKAQNSDWTQSQDSDEQRRI